jgi:hypothetical protein
MRLVPTYLKRFSLRSILVVMTVAALILGLHLHRVRENKHAIRKLRDRGASIGGSTFDPLGPNFLYTLNFYRIPNGYFSTWFEEQFCVEVVDNAMFIATTVHPEDIRLLAKVPLTGVLIRDSRLEPETIASIVTYCRFRHLGLDNTQLTSTDVSHLARMTWLEYLSLTGTSAQATGLDQLRASLPDCEVYVD